MQVSTRYVLIRAGKNKQNHNVDYCHPPQEDVDVKRDLVPNLRAVRGQPARQVARLRRVEKTDFLTHERVKQTLPHPHVDSRPDNRENASPGALKP